MTAIAAGVLLSGVLGWTLRSHMQTPAVEAYAALRVPVINAHLAEAPAGFILVAGDSHAELSNPAITLCGAELVDAGISGAHAALWADRVLPSLQFATRARAAVLLIGTNDIQKKIRPTDPQRSAAFVDDVTRIVRGLQPHAEQIIVAALPPLGRSVRKLDAGAEVQYSAHLAALCQRLGCTYTDPFADLRDGADGFAKVGASADGVHLRRYRAALKSLEPMLCKTSPPHS